MIWMDILYTMSLYIDGKFIHLLLKKDDKKFDT